MATGPLVHFEIHAEDPERAAAFYTALFGWDIKKWDSDVMEYWMIKTREEGAPGINGGLLRRRGPTPAADACVMGYVCSMEVPDIDATIAAIQEKGGSIALPKMAIAGMLWMAYAKDTEGNIFGVVQNDKNAK